VKEVAIITGGTRGIGLGIAKSLASHGIDLILNGMRDQDSIEPVMQELSNFGVNVKYVQGSVGEDDIRKNIVNTAIEEYGQLNFLINNAGVAPNERNDILDMTEKSYDRVMDINLKGSVFLSQLAAKQIIKTKVSQPECNTAIINISSVSATVVSINRGEYCMSKAGMSMLTQLFAARLGEEGIPVFEIRPGLIKTDMTSTVTDKYDALIEGGLCVTKRWGIPEDIGKVVLNLVKGDFMYSTGQVFMVDGALTMSTL
jgi:NAD(P)-dependent dehydrogenase (short-subunit alcohol dehydrogenase family)